MNGAALTSSAALLDSEGPGELIQRAALLDYVAANQVDVLGAAGGRQGRAGQRRLLRPRGPRRDGRRRGGRRGGQGTQADAQLAAQQGAYEQVAAQKAAYDQQLQAAQIRLLELQGARNAYDQWVAQKQAEEAAARGRGQKAGRATRPPPPPRPHGTTPPAGGGGGGGGRRRWSSAATTPSRPPAACPAATAPAGASPHYGVDIAAPIGTPIYAATSGVVKRAGTATGFGLAVYILGDDGYVTVYGHVNRYFVSVGERVSAGEQIAEVGNRGQSTGPHLHFEVHPGGVDVRRPGQPGAVAQQPGRVPRGLRRLIGPLQGPGASLRAVGGRGSVLSWSATRARTAVGSSAALVPQVGRTRWSTGAAQLRHAGRQLLLQDDGRVRVGEVDRRDRRRRSARCRRRSALQSEAISAGGSIAADVGLELPRSGPRQGGQVGLARAGGGRPRSWTAGGLRAELRVGAGSALLSDALELVSLEADD